MADIKTRDFHKIAFQKQLGPCREFFIRVARQAIF